jgi:S1-C subfamily serine protease
MVIAPDGYVLTNHHVVQGADRVTTKFSFGEDSGARVMGRDAKTDLAVLRLDSSGSALHLPLLDKRDVKVGQIVLAIGNPLRFERSVTLGLVSAIDRALPSRHGNLEGLIQTDAAINPGNSGGPLLSTRGEVVGVNTAIVPYAQGLGFAVPAYTASWVAGELLHKGRVRRRYLGVAAAGVELPERNVAQENDTIVRAVRRGVFVHRVETGSPADRAGLKDGDILTRADARDLYNLDDLQRVLSLGEARAIELELRRGGESLRKSVVPLETA